MCAWVPVSAVTISASPTARAGRALEDRRSGVAGQPADLPADDDHQHGPLADEPAGRGLVGEPDDGDPVRPTRGDARLDRGADVVAVQVDVPEVAAVADDRDAVAQLGQLRAQAVDGVRGRVEEVHHLVVVRRRARLARGGQRGPVPDARTRRRRGRPVGEQRRRGRRGGGRRPCRPRRPPRPAPARAAARWWRAARLAAASPPPRVAAAASRGGGPQPAAASRGGREHREGGALARVGERRGRQRDAAGQRVGEDGGARAPRRRPPGRHPPPPRPRRAPAAPARGSPRSCRTPPASAPRARAGGDPPSGSAAAASAASTAERMVSSRLVPVSASATGKTLMPSSSGRCGRQTA